MSALQDAIQSATLDRIKTPGAVDAVVIGAGGTGGYASYILTAAGLNVLVLNAGADEGEPPIRPPVERVAHRLFGRGAANFLRRRRQPVQSRCYAWHGAPWAFVDDRDCPYTTEADKPFIWLRARQLGGRLAIPGHGRQYYRLSSTEMYRTDDSTPSWPIQEKDLAFWYSRIETDIGLAGRHDGNPYLPDSTLTRELEFSEDETALMEQIHERWPSARPMLSRFATPPSFLDAAAATGRLLIRTLAVVRRLHIDEAGRICAVTWIDGREGREVQLDAPLVFLCASALESTRILLLSQSARHPGGLGGDSGALGRYLMDHIRVRLWGRRLSLAQSEVLEPGRCLFLPPIPAGGAATPEGFGFGIQIHLSGAPGEPSQFGAFAFGEMVPRRENRVMLNLRRVDAWGIPVLHIECAHGPEDRALAQRARRTIVELAEAAGARIDQVENEPAPPGAANHECGTARLGPDPSSSVLDPHNECWDARGLFVTDAACLPSQGYQNPTLTIMALTARACAYALAKYKGMSMGLEDNGTER